MPNVIDRGSREKENLVEFLRKHLVVRIYDYEVTEKPRFFWQTADTIKYVFALSYDEESNEEGDDIAEILVAEPNTIYVLDRSFLEDFTELAAKYERYNPSVTVTVIVKNPED